MLRGHLVHAILATVIIKRCFKENNYKFKILSKPSRQIFISMSQLNYLINNNVNDSIFILNTPYGMMTHKTAQLKKTGGKLICILKK